MRSFREDVHIHAASSQVFARLADFERLSEWLPAAFRGIEHDPWRLRFDLDVPGRSEAADLCVEQSQTPELLQLASTDGRASSIAELTWLISAESGRESHLSVETHYHPAGGPFGPLLDLTLHRPHRRQAFRDALWRLKLLIEERD